MSKKLRSVTITIQDVTLKDGFTVAAIHGGLVIDSGDKQLDEKTQQYEPILEKINFRVPLEEYPHIKEFYEEIKQMTVEALRLKAMKIAQEEGLMSVLNRPTPKKRVSKVRSKK